MSSVLVSSAYIRRWQARSTQHDDPETSICEYVEDGRIKSYWVLGMFELVIHTIVSPSRAPCPRKGSCY